MSTRETVLAALASTLAALASGRVYRSRRESLPGLPAIIIQPASADADEVVLGLLDQRLRVAIAIYAEGDVPDTAADAVLSGVWSALQADPHLGLGSEVQLEQAHTIDWEFEDFDQVRVTLSVTVQYRTAVGTM